MTLLYFAWLRQVIGSGEEQITLPPGIGDVRGLIAHLKGLDAKYAQVFADEGRIRTAVNQHHAALDAPVSDGDEIAFFPPVTGG